MARGHNLTSTYALSQVGLNVGWDWLTAQPVGNWAVQVAIVSLGLAPSEHFALGHHRAQDTPDITQGRRSEAPDPLPESMRIATVVANDDRLTFAL